MQSSIRAALFFVPLFTLLAHPAVAAPAPALAVPPLDGQPSSHLTARVVAYSGHTNGDITVEITNRGQSAETFVARGLFFVPDGDPNSAPQRVGAVGPFRVGATATRKDMIEVAPGEHVTVTVDVYCIDSQRSSPSPSTRFHLAEKRLPKELANGIAHDAHQAADSYGGVSAPAAKSAVQGEVWKNRDKKWIKLEGEGRQEAGK